MQKFVYGLLLALIAARSPAGIEERAIEIEVDLDAELEQVWNAWTTPQGIRAFFAPDCHVDIRVDGLYEIFFNPDAELGRRGADGMRILVLEPMKRFAFTWNAPLSMPRVRQQRTVVTLNFQPSSVDHGHTKMRLRHDGWGEGEEWDEAFEYFSKAWRESVLPRLVYAMNIGPVDWSRLPELEPIQ